MNGQRIQSVVSDLLAAPRAARPEGRIRSPIVRELAIALDQYKRKHFTILSIITVSHATSKARSQVCLGGRPSGMRGTVPWGWELDTGCVTAWCINSNVSRDTAWPISPGVVR
jgi:hypothetical protein